MKEFLLNINITEQTIYLGIILLVIAEGLKGLTFINRWMIIWILVLISIIINFIFYGISFYTLIESIFATSLATFMYELIKQTKKGISKLN